MASPDERPSIYGAFRFWIEIGGIYKAGFSEVTGLQAETEYEEYAEGGVNGFVHRFPKKTKFPPLVLKRGITTSDYLWDWYVNVMGGKLERRDGAIMLVDQSGNVVREWAFTGAYPTKWSGPDLNASRSDVAIEALELVHNGFKRSSITS